MSEQKKQIDILQEECDALGIGIYDLFREAKEPTATIQNWRRDDPKPIKTLKNLNDTLTRLKNEKWLAETKMSPVHKPMTL